MKTPVLAHCLLPVSRRTQWRKTLISLAALSCLGQLAQAADAPQVSVKQIEIGQLSQISAGGTSSALQQDLLSQARQALLPNAGAGLVGVDDIHRVEDRLTQVLRDKGYLVGRVIVIDADLAEARQSGLLRFTVLEGRYSSALVGKDSSPITSLAWR